MSHAPDPTTPRRFRRTLLAATGVVALAAATLGSSQVAGARPLIAVEVTATATPTEAVVGETVTVTGTVAAAYVELTSDDDAVVMGCASADDVSVATACPLVPTGDVEILVDDAAAGSATLDGTAAFSWSTDDLAVGTHQIVVTYSNEEYDEPGESAPMTVTITEPVASTPVPAPTGAYRDGGTSLTATAGGAVTVTGSGWHADSQVTTTLRSDPVVLGTAGVGADGSFAQQYTIPASTPPGAHTITLDGTGPDGQPASVVLSLQVVAGAEEPVAQDVPRSLSFTG